MLLWLRIQYVKDEKIKAALGTPVVKNTSRATSERTEQEGNDERWRRGAAADDGGQPSSLYGSVGLAGGSGDGGEEY